MAKAAKGFAPVVDGGIETLILGSFPSVASLGKAQYYGHPQNHFWKLVGAVIGEPLAAMQYEQRLTKLLEHRIGLWDVIGTCVRAGSLDSNIRNARHNDFEQVTAVARNLRRVCFNGKSAGRMEPVFSELGFETTVLPSSSPANTMRFDDKLRQWRQIAAVVLQRPVARIVDTASASSSPSASSLTRHKSRRKC